MILPLRHPGLAPRGYYQAPHGGLHKVGRTCWTPPIASLRLCVSMPWLLWAVSFPRTPLSALSGLRVETLASAKTSPRRWRGRRRIASPQIPFICFHPSAHAGRFKGVQSPLAGLRPRRKTNMYVRRRVPRACAAGLLSVAPRGASQGWTDLLFSGHCAFASLREHVVGRFPPVSLCALCGLCVRGLRLEVVGRRNSGSQWPRPETVSEH